MKTTIRFSKIETVALNALYSTKFYYEIDLRDSIVNTLEVRIRMIGDTNDEFYKAELAYNGSFFILQNKSTTFKSGKLYQISARVGLRAGSDVSWAPWCNWENLRLEKLPTVHHNLTSQGTDYIVKNQAFDATITYDQADNDVLIKYKFDLYNEQHELIQSHKWQYSRGFPLQGGTIQVKSIPAAAFNIVYKYSHSTEVAINVWPRRSPWQNISEVVFDIAQSISEFTDLAFSISRENPSIINISSKRQVIGVELRCDNVAISCVGLSMQDIHAPFSDLQLNTKYYFTVKMVSLRNLQTQYKSPLFTVDFSSATVDSSANISLEDPFDATIKISLDTIKVVADSVDKLPNKLIIARKKKAELNPHCISTNLELLPIQEQVVEVGHLELKQTSNAANTYNYENLTFIDTSVEDGAQYEYIVLIQTPNLKLQTILTGENKIIPNFDGSFIGDEQHRFRLLLGGKVGNITYKTSNGVLEPLENAFPVVSYGQLNYKSGQFNGKLISGQQANVGSVIMQGAEFALKEHFIQWINNKKPKVFQLGNGKTLIVSIVGQVQLIEDDSFINGVSFDWNEIGELSTETLQTHFPSNYFGLKPKPKTHYYTV